jgi:predicted dehydrogenase
MIRTAVIGVGSMGENHARVYAHLPQTRLVGVADADTKIARAVGERFGVPAYTDFQEMLSQEKPEAVSIAVPTALHEEVATLAMQAGAHVLVEKPIADSLAAGQRMIEQAKKLNRQLMVGHIIRFNPATQALKLKLEAEALGRVFQIVCRRIGPFPERIRDVGVVLDLAPHDLDVMRFLLGMEPLRVFAETEQRIHTAHEDLMSAMLRFPNGVIGTLETNWLTPNKVREIIVLGERGMFRVDDLTQDLYLYQNQQATGELWGTLQTIKGVSEGQMVRYAIQRQEPLQAELQAFIQAIQNDSPVPVRGEDGLAALRLALALVKSGRRHKVIAIENDFINVTKKDQL